MNSNGWFDYSPGAEREGEAVELAEDQEYAPLGEVDENLERALTDRFARSFIDQSRFPASRLPDARRTVAIFIKGDGTELKVTSYYTGSTWWYEWDGTVSDAEAIIERAALDCAYLVAQERSRDGATDWDFE